MKHFFIISLWIKQKVECSEIEKKIEATRNKKKKHNSRATKTREKFFITKHAH